MLFAIIGAVAVVLLVKHRKAPPVPTDPPAQNPDVDPATLEQPPRPLPVSVEANPYANDVAPVARPPQSVPSWAAGMKAPPRLPVTRSTLVDKEAGVLQLQSDGRLRALDTLGRAYEPDAVVYQRMGVPVPFDVSVPAAPSTQLVPKVRSREPLKVRPASQNIKAGANMRPKGIVK